MGVDGLWMVLYSTERKERTSGEGRGVDYKKRASKGYLLLDKMSD